MADEYLSFYLFAKPSFAAGIARILDFNHFINEYNNSPDADTADFLAITSDWLAIGSDMQETLTRFAKEHPEVINE